jgi:hypothetical protein
VTVFQFVCFETSLPRETFLATWAPFASGFLARGLERLVLSERAGSEGFAFVSRNAWPAERFTQTFGGQLPADAGGGPVRAIQGGAFRLAACHGVDPLVVDPAPKLVAFLDDARDLAHWQSLLASVPPGTRWARYERLEAVKGGRFGAVCELFAPQGMAIDGTGARPMREVLTLPAARA